jgi:nitrogen regulatory protein PII-like uncharacterized protein
MSESVFEPTVVNEEEAEAVEEKSVNDLRREAYSVATTRLRTEFRKEFDAILTEEYTSRGLEYQPRLSDEEKAVKKMRELAEKAVFVLTDEMIAQMQQKEND